MKLIAMLLLCVGLRAGGLRAGGQTPASPIDARTKIDFECNTCDSDIAQRFAMKVRDLLAASPRYREFPLESYKDNGVVYATPTLKVMTLSTEGGHAIAIAYILTVGNEYLGSGLYECGTDKVDQMAENALAFVDSNLHRWAAATPSNSSATP